MYSFSYSCSKHAYNTYLYQTSSVTAIVNKRGVNFQPVDQGQSSVSKKTGSLWHRLVEVITQFLEELMSPPAIATVSSFSSAFLSVSFVRFVCEFGL